MDITKEELEEILARAKRATGGAWISFIEGRDHVAGSNFIRTAGDDIELHAGAREEDQDFIAAARQDVPRLVAVIAALKGWSIDGLA